MTNFAALKQIGLVLNIKH